MARILPEIPPLALPGETLRTFLALKALPDSFFVWHHLAPWQADTPDFLVLNQDQRALLVKVSSSAPAHAVNAAQLLLLGDTLPPLGAAEAAVLGTFVHRLQLPAEIALETLVIFPNITHKNVMESRLARLQGDPQWAGKELLQPDSLEWESFLPAAPIDPAWLEKLRQKFSPEALVPAEMTVRMPGPQHNQAGLTDYLLDYDQEAAVKADLEIQAEGQSLSGDFRLNIINGVAGSGKTLILLFRLRLFYHLYPGKQFLVLTHNKPLCLDLQSRFHRLEGCLPENIEWRTFNGWCRGHWPKKPAWVQPLSIRRRQKIVRSVYESTLRDSAISERMLLSEIDWLKDQLPVEKDVYITIDRRGRGFGLNTEQRRRMWQAICSYQEEMDKQQALDWGDVARRLWQTSAAGQAAIPQYDFILVDEAQFFAPLWFNLVQKALKPPNAHLFIVADPTQGFLSRRATWKSMGLEARGRSQQLRRSYRTTREIMQFATLLYRLRLPQENDDDVLAPDLLNMPNGVFPQVIPLGSAQDEIARVANEVTALLSQGYPRKNLLLLHANGQGVSGLIHAIDQRVGKNSAMDPKGTYPGNYVRVTTINAGAGLESPIVFLVGLRELFEEEQSLRLADEEREELIRSNTRKIFMAATRAGQRLVLTYVGDLPEVIRQVFGQSIE